MIRLFMNISCEIDDNILVSIIKSYLNIHRLLYYSSHSDQELSEIVDILQYLEIIISKFFDDLQNSHETLIQSNIIKVNFMTNKLHTIIHYFN